MKRHIYNFFLNSLPFIVSLIPGIIAIPLYLKFLGTTQLGVYYLYLTLVGMGSAFDLGISQTLIKFIAAYKLKSKYYVSYIISSSRAILNLLLCACSILFVLYVFIGFFFLKDFNLLSVSLFFVGFSLQFMLNFELAINRGYEEFKIVAFYETFQKVTFTVLGITLAYFFKNINLVLLLHIIITIGIIGYINLLKFKNKNKNTTDRTLSFKVFFFKKVLLEYSKWVFVQNLIGFLNGSLDKFVVASFINLKTLTSYNTSQNLTGVFQGFIAKGLAYLLPYASKMDDRESLRKFFVRGNFLLSNVLGVVYIAGTILAPTVIRWYLKSDLVVAEQVILYFDVLLIASLFSCTAMLSWHLFNGMGEIKINTTIPLIFNVIGIVLMVVLGYFYGIWGIVYSKLIGALFSIIVRTISYNKVFKKRDFLIGIKLAAPLIISVLIVEVIKKFLI